MPPSSKPGSDPWRNRIVGHREADPTSLLPHPENWRRHPTTQQQALLGLLNRVGLVQRVIWNRLSGRLVDGHLRVALAIETNQPSIPVIEVELSEAEEALVLSTFDPITLLATADTERLAVLLSRLPNTDDEALDALIATLTPAPLPPPLPAPLPAEEDAPPPEPACHECPQCGTRWPKDRKGLEDAA